MECGGAALLLLTVFILSLLVLEGIKKNQQLQIEQHLAQPINQTFNNEIRQLFVVIGASIFFLSFFLAYVYFNSFAVEIIRLNRTVDSIREGRYNAETLSRRDEIGELSEGIRAMSAQI